MQQSTTTSPHRGRNSGFDTQGHLNLRSKQPLISFHLKQEFRMKPESRYLALALSCFLAQPCQVVAYAALTTRKIDSFGLRYRSSLQIEEFPKPSVTDGDLVGVKEAPPFPNPSAQAEFQQQSLTLDPSQIEFAPSAVYYDQFHSKTNSPELSPNDIGQFYPLALMLHNSASYIASHSGQTAVFHIPGEYIVDKHESSDLFSDIALAHLLGMKIVIVVGCRFDRDTCSLDFAGHSHECQNSLKSTPEATLRQIEEEAGYLRVEVERKLNRHLKLNGMVASAEGNVVSGNFYTARQFGNIRGEDFENTGFTSGVHVSNIQHRLDNNDIVLLTTVGVSPLGELVNVNGYHLTATVAFALKAYKIIYLANEGSILKHKDSIIQEMPLSSAQALTDYHQVHVHKTGFATFENARQHLDAGAVELLLHLSWASWALERGVRRAHIVNPGDGAILEELFTSKNGLNTCLYHDSEDREESLEDCDSMDAYFSESEVLSRRQHPR